ncbi:two-component sensor kinase [Oryzomicrobium terrae]|uniref:histidine kinase n=1 Tax=Oryzomicrobium terrae TaxID=1735038 RepID=A0A5C1EA84_9RHOO|nr:ATP-binding protein [Oryzomicrobium terrae]QEL65816.1 two-component sensor kinase [Oryzomicrobium terrae]
MSAATPDAKPSKPRIRSRLPMLPRGRYSLSRLFFNFYLFVMGSFVLIAFFADIVINTALQGITDDYARRFMRGTILLIEEELNRHPAAEWPDTLKRLDDKFSYRLALVKRNQMRLAEAQLDRLDSGDIAIDNVKDVMYHRLTKHADLVLEVGPLSPDRNPEMKRTIPLELRIRLLTWSIIGVGFGVVAWLWLRPIWRDLESIRETAKSLAEGEFAARAPLPRTRTFALLARTLNGMAERIQRLIATQKEMSSAISHELRTPIARLRFALDMLGETEERAERERLWAGMEADLDELDTLIDSSLTYARLEREQPEPVLAPVTLRPWLEDQLAAVRPLAGALRLELDAGQLDERQQVAFDRKVMPFALSNLLRNGVKYAKSGIVIRPELDPASGWVRLHVDDDGIGIPADEREHIFTAFTRLDRSRDRATGGYGLGLAIARQVMEAHGGSATAGESPEGGARLTLAWPGLAYLTTKDECDG